MQRFRLKQSARSFHSSVHRATRPVDGLSYVIGETHPPLLTDTFPQLWQAISSKHAMEQALVIRHEHAQQIQRSFLSGSSKTDDCLRWTFSDMSEHIESLCRGLQALGLKKGDVIGAFMGHNSTYCVLQWAAAKLGIILATINPSYRMPELIATLKMIHCRALFITPTLRSSNYLSMLASSIPSLSSSKPNEIQDETLPELKSVYVVDNLSSSKNGMRTSEFQDLLSKTSGVSDARELYLEWNSASAAPVHLVNTDIVNLQFTSGTTGLAKAVPLSHKNLLNNGFFIGRRMELSSIDVLCNVPPLFHCFGSVLGNLAAWTNGASIVLPSESFDPKATLRAVEGEKCTALHGVPTMFISQLHLLEMIDHGEHVDGLEDLSLHFSSLRTGIAAGSPVPHETMRRMMKRMNLNEQTIAYGMTETSPVSFQSTTKDPVDLRCETIGTIHPHQRAKVVHPGDPDLKPLPVGEPGELVVSGYNVMQGYWENKKETDAVLKIDDEGRTWMLTGDQVIMDENGYVQICGRIKDVIIRGGENLYPVQIENALMDLEYVDAASVVSVPSKLFGEEVGAFLVFNSDVETLGTDWRSKIRQDLKGHLNGQAIPTWMFEMGKNNLPEDYPKTASGKIRKVELREWAENLVKEGIGAVPKS